VNVGSLFSGIGGIELGFERAGFTTSWFVECDKYCQAILRKHWPEAKIYGDIKEVDFNSVPKVDILTGGFPCQDISNAGKRAGIKGSRSSLWKYYLKAIGILRPKYILIENVSAAIRPIFKDGKLVDTSPLYVILQDLAKERYDAEWHCITASSVGAYHRRDRIFVLAYSNGADKGALLGGASKAQEALRRQEEGNVSSGCCDAGKLSDVADASVNGCENRHTDGGGFEFGCQEGRVLQSSGGSDKENVPNSEKSGLQGEMWKELQEPNPNREFTRCSLSGYWATEPGMGRVAHGISNRVDRIKCLGNAVVPQVAEVIARAIMEVENGY
jgi:DNA (cytosine-5)-methyltransferase 1